MSELAARPARAARAAPTPTAVCGSINLCVSRHTRAISPVVSGLARAMRVELGTNRGERPGIEREARRIAGGNSSACSRLPRHGRTSRTKAARNSRIPECPLRAIVWLRHGRSHNAPVVQCPDENVIRIGSNDEPLDRQPHLLRHPSRREYRRNCQSGRRRTLADAARRAPPALVK